MKKFTIKYCNSFDIELRSEEYTGEKISKSDAYIYAANNCKENETRVTVIDDSAEEPRVSTSEIAECLKNIISGPQMEEANMTYDFLDDIQTGKIIQNRYRGDSVYFPVFTGGEKFFVSVYKDIRIDEGK